MPKQKRSKPTALYDHNARPIVARQLHISRSAKTGRTLYYYTSSLIRLKRLTPVHTQAGHELHGTGCPTGAGMDIDGNHVANPAANVDEDADQPVEVMPGIHATTKVTKPKGHKNSVSLPVFK